MDILIKVSEAALVLFSTLTLIVCVYSWYTYDDLPALGYLVPIIYFVIYYTVSLFADMNPQVQLVWGRVGVMMLMGNIAVWRFVRIIQGRRQKKKNLESTLRWKL